jgi:DnaK suppressor protein
VPPSFANYERLASAGMPYREFFQTARLGSRIHFDRERKMTQQDIGRYRKVLEEKMVELTSGLSSRDEIAIERSADQIDEIQRAVERDVAIHTLDSKASMLRSVTAALRRSDEGSFGVCIRCDHEISPKRLAAVPWAPYCISCQETADRMESLGETADDEVQIA